MQFYNKLTDLIRVIYPKSSHTNMSFNPVLETKPYFHRLSKYHHSQPKSRRHQLHLWQGSGAALAVRGECQRLVGRTAVMAAAERWAIIGCQNGDGMGKRRVRELGVDNGVMKTASVLMGTAGWVQTRTTVACLIVPLLLLSLFKAPLHLTLSPLCLQISYE